MYLQDIEILKEIPGYKALLKAVIKSQIQMLVEQLSDQTGEESVILTASMADGTLCQLGSVSGKDFLDGREELKTQFLSHCLTKISKRRNTDTESTTKKARYVEPLSQGQAAESDFPLHEQYEPMYSTQDQPSNVDWELPPSMADYETSRARGGKLVVRKKRFKNTPSTSRIVSVEKETAKDRSLEPSTHSIKIEPSVTDPSKNLETDSVSNIGASETQVNELVAGESDTSLHKPVVKLEAEEEEDSNDMAIIGVEPGMSAEGFQGSEMDSSYNQSFQEDNSFLSSNSGDISYSQTGSSGEAFRNPPGQHYDASELGRMSMKMVTTPMSALTCPLCFKQLSSNSSLTTHMLIHSEQKSHVCDICNKRFRLKHHLSRHKMGVHFSHVLQ